MDSKSYNLTQMVLASMFSFLMAGLLAMYMGVPTVIEYFSPYTADRQRLTVSIDNLTVAVSQLRVSVENLRLSQETLGQRISNLEGKVEGLLKNSR